MCSVWSIKALPRRCLISPVLITPSAWSHFIGFRSQAWAYPCNWAQIGLEQVHGIRMCAQSCPTLCSPTDCGPPGSSVPGIPQARRLEWVAISFSRGSSWPRDRSRVSYISWLDFLKRKLTITTDLKGRKKRREVGREGGRQRNRQAQKEEREVKARKSGHRCRRALKLLWWLRLRFLTQLNSQQFLPSVREPNGPIPL